jgi:catechol 2,3-dioxygenase-like lactoylglutathione lyase family enzyme
METTVPPVTGYHHIGLTVCDVDRSEEWYGKVLGFERAFVEPHNEADGYAVVMNRPGTHLFIGLDNHGANEGERFGEHRTGLDHLAIGVAERSDLDTWVDHLDALGVAHSKINEVTEPFPYATVIVRDPDNIQLELMWM